MFVFSIVGYLVFIMVAAITFKSVRFMLFVLSQMPNL